MISDGELKPHGTCKGIAGERPSRSPDAVVSEGCSEVPILYSPVPYELNVFTETRDLQLEKRVQVLLEGMGLAWQRDNYIVDTGVTATYQITLVEE